MELNDYVLEKARAANICEPWADKIAQAQSVDELLQMYVAGIDFCLEKEFPSISDLELLGGDIINAYGIYINAAPKLQDRPFVVALGACDISLSVTNHNVSQLFVKHESRANVRVADNSFVVIDVFDNSVTHVAAEGQAKVLINVYGQATISTEGSGSVKIVNKLKQTY